MDFIHAVAMLDLKTRLGVQATVMAATATDKWTPPDTTVVACAPHQAGCTSSSSPCIGHQYLPRAPHRAAAAPARAPYWVTAASVPHRAAAAPAPTGTAPGRNNLGTEPRPHRYHSGIVYWYRTGPYST
ncbi:UNVERIFIED_CONTAM: hypothetical protein FKN15_060864 [Acipenser sinensis]